MLHSEQEHYILYTWPDAILDLLELGLMWWVQDQEVWIIGCEDLVFEEVCKCYFWPLFGMIRLRCSWQGICGSNLMCLVLCIGCVNMRSVRYRGCSVWLFNYWWYPSRKCGWFRSWSLCKRGFKRKDCFNKPDMSRNKNLYCWWIIAKKGTLS